MLSRHRGEETKWGLCVSRLVKAKAALLHDKQAQRGSRGISLSIFDADARKWWVVSATSWTFYRREIHQAPIAQEDVWASGHVWMVPQNLALTGFSRSRSLSP